MARKTKTTGKLRKTAASRGVKRKRGKRKLGARGRPAPRSNNDLRLLADVGGTHIRLALQRGRGGIGPVQSFACADFGCLDDAIDSFLRKADGVKPGSAALAVAAAVGPDKIELTNHPWAFSTRALRRHFGFSRLEIINDVAALALAVPRLQPKDLTRIGGGTRIKNGAVAVVAPGTGLGMAAVVCAKGGPSVVWGEGGHATLAACNARESDILAVLRRRFGQVSAERAVSGPGLVNLFNAVAELEGVEAPHATPEGVARRALDKSSAFCGEALELLCAMLGTVAANAALTFWAQGGVYIGGGIIPRLGAYFAASPFRRRFETNGQFADFLKSTPAFVIRHENAGLLGLAALLDASEAGRP